MQLWSSWFMLSFTFLEVAKVGRSNSIRGKDGKRDLILCWRGRMPGGRSGDSNEPGRQLGERQLRFW